MNRNFERSNEQHGCHIFSSLFFFSGFGTEVCPGLKIQEGSQTDVTVVEVWCLNRVIAEFDCMFK